jgi:hypothetical protein
VPWVLALLSPLQARDEKGSAAAIQEEMKDVPPLAQMASEIKDEVYDDLDEILDAGTERGRVFFYWGALDRRGLSCEWWITHQDWSIL